jgi:hypothetical protein
MEQMIGFAAELALWGSIALLVWGATLCVQELFGGERKDVDRSRQTTQPGDSALRMDGLSSE